jgi:hypothetical protein
MRSSTTSGHGFGGFKDNERSGSGTGVAAVGIALKKRELEAIGTLPHPRAPSIYTLYFVLGTSGPVVWYTRAVSIVEDIKAKEKRWMSLCVLR